MYAWRVPLFAESTIRYVGWVANLDRSNGALRSRESHKGTCLPRPAPTAHNEDLLDFTMLGKDLRGENVRSGAHVLHGYGELGVVRGGPRVRAGIVQVSKEDLARSADARGGPEQRFSPAAASARPCPLVRLR